MFCQSEVPNGRCDLCSLNSVVAVFSGGVTIVNQRKDDYLSSLNRLKEKAIRSKFPLNMTNDMIALASIWEDRLRPPKCDKKEDPQVWATSFPHLLTLTQKEKKLNTKAMITYKRPTTIGQKLTNYKDLALKKTRK